MTKIELLSPVGDFECLKAAVQNGADAVYFGANTFSARAFATNFNDEEMKRAINYAKIRNVKTHLTLNTLIKNQELDSAFSLAKRAYEYGIDAIIVQDLGLATLLISSFPDLEIHSSTQMTTTNLPGVKFLENLGFKRIVLSRETSLSEIENICKNCSSEIEVFVHGALCISYSGQCLFSSMVGGRSGNRGQCAQPCRLPYKLINENQQILSKGHLLSTKDLCTLEFLSQLIKAGVKSFKIEGRMKTPTYVATVTRIYRKYIDLALKFNNNEISEYKIQDQDINDLLQVFNRGGFSIGHLSPQHNKNLIYSHKPNNMGILIGKVLKYNNNKGHITLKLTSPVALGDSISFENEPTKYKISELMEKNSNISSTHTNQIVTLGRMKGNINKNDNVYKITDKSLYLKSLESYDNEKITTPLLCSLQIHKNKQIQVETKSLQFNIVDNFIYDFTPNLAQNAPLNIEKIKTQFSKTLNTCFKFENIEIFLDEGLFIPTSILNDIRRTALSRIEAKIYNSFTRTTTYHFALLNSNKDEKYLFTKKTILLNILHKNFDYTKLKSVDRIYIPLKYFIMFEFSNIIKILSQKSKIFIYMPTIIKDKYYNIIQHQVNLALNNFSISGAVISNFSELSMFNNVDLSSFNFIANYTFNIYNNYTINKLSNIGFSNFVISPELKSDELKTINNENLELIINGYIPLMTMSYCLLGNSNSCYPECANNCTSKSKYYLNDRYNFNFRIIPDNTQTITTIYNSRKILLDNTIINFPYIRYDFLDESIDEINQFL